MIQFVAADMDGTLLNSKKELSPELVPVIHKLFDKGVRFAIASGRQYHNLVHLFKDLADELIFIAENGALVYDRGKKIIVHSMDLGLLQSLLKKIRQIPSAHLILCGENAAYAESTDPVFLENARMYYKRFEQVTDLSSCLSKDQICNLAVFDTTDAEHNCYAALLPFQEQVQVVLSGAHWVDLMNLNVNKGEAIREIQSLYKISPDDCMSFGDYLNDYEMMLACTQSWAMANAHPKLKEAARFEAPSNDEDGVVKVLKKTFGI